MSWFKRDPDGPPPYSSKPGGPSKQPNTPKQPSAPRTSTSAIPTDPLDGWACLTLSRDDRLRLINFPPSMIDVVRTALNNAWAEGIRSETDRPEWGHNAYEFKLDGYPCTLHVDHR